MQLSYCPNGLVEMPEHLKTPALHDALKVTTSLYVVVDEDPLAWIGVMRESHMSQNAYLWTVLERPHFTTTELRQVRELFNPFAHTFDAVIWAEVEAASLRNNKFAQFLGFEFTEQLGERNVYKWGTH